MTDNNPRGVDCSYLGDKLKGSYNIHTHPPDTTQYSFSTDADIPAAFSDGTAIMEAVDYKYRYQLCRAALRLNSGKVQERRQKHFFPQFWKAFVSRIIQTTRN